MAELTDEGKARRVSMMKGIRDDETIADTAFERGDITMEERRQYNAIHEKIWQAEIERVEEDLPPGYLSDFRQG